MSDAEWVRAVREVCGEERCNCDEGYTTRNLTDPSCFKCNCADEIRDEIERRMGVSDE